MTCLLASYPIEQPHFNPGPVVHDAHVEDVYSFFPNHHRKRYARPYGADEGREETPEQVCLKNAYRHGSLNPGM